MQGILNSSPDDSTLSLQGPLIWVKPENGKEVSAAGFVPGNAAAAVNADKPVAAVQ